MSSGDVFREYVFTAPPVMVKGSGGYSRVSEDLGKTIMIYYFDRECVYKRLFRLRRKCVVKSIDLVYYPFILSCNNEGCYILDPVGVASSDIVRDHGLIADLVILFNKAIKTHIVDVDFIGRDKVYRQAPNVEADVDREYTVPRVSPEGIYLIPLPIVCYANQGFVEKIYSPIYLSQATIFVKGYIGVFPSIHRFAQKLYMEMKYEINSTKMSYIDIDNPVTRTMLKENLGELQNLLLIIDQDIEYFKKTYL